MLTAAEQVTANFAAEDNDTARTWWAPSFGPSSGGVPTDAVCGWLRVSASATASPPGLAPGGGGRWAGTSVSLHVVSPWDRLGLPQRGGWVSRSSVGREATSLLHPQLEPTLSLLSCSGIEAIRAGESASQGGEGPDLRPSLLRDRNAPSKGPLPPCPRLAITRRKCNLGSDVTQNVTISGCPH